MSGCSPAPRYRRRPNPPLSLISGVATAASPAADRPEGRLLEAAGASNPAPHRSSGQSGDLVRRDRGAEEEPLAPPAPQLDQVAALRFQLDPLTQGLDPHGMGEANDGGEQAGGLRALESVPNEGRGDLQHVDVQLLQPGERRIR